MTIQNHYVQRAGRSFQDRVRANAAVCPDTSNPSGHEFARSLQRFLKIENRRLRISHDLGAQGVQTAADRAFVLDIVVRMAFARAGAALTSGDTQNGGALLAVGGYGRAELAPFSDVDLVFLYSKQRLSQMKLLSESLLQLLWDAGLTVGYSFRTVGDCVAAVFDDPHLRTALVHTRLLAGNQALHKSLQVTLEKD